MFISVVDKHIPKYCIKSVHDYLWIDKELFSQIKKKNIQRRKLKKFPSPASLEKYKNLRRLTKQLINKKKKQYNIKLTESLCENPQRFWAAVKHSTEHRKNINFLKTEGSFTTDKLKMANTLNIPSFILSSTLTTWSHSPNVPYLQCHQCLSFPVFNSQRLKLLVFFAI